MNYSFPDLLGGQGIKLAIDYCFDRLPNFWEVSSLLTLRCKNSNILSHLVLNIKNLEN
jgi:hypothetical protein